MTNVGCLKAGYPLMVVLAALVISLEVTAATPYCQRGESCWPTIWDVSRLSSVLDADAPRRLYWAGAGTPRVSAVPVYSFDDQPLYGVGVSYLKPVYTQENSDRAETCFVNNHNTDYCCVSVRNTPYEDWTPAFVVWPLSVAHVQATVQFARKHQLCISVAGTGHDFMNRHSCDQGVFIRTALMKNISFDLDAETVTVGPGTVFSEIEYAAAKHGRYIASGWADTVGIVGWSIGGGHGPFGPSAGLGVDNLVAVEVVVANGSHVAANASVTVVTDLDGTRTVFRTPARGLLWALRGGGGSAWGVIMSLTIRLHKNPANGFTHAIVYWQGDLCTGRSDLDTLIDKHMNWSLSLGTSWSGLTFVTPQRNLSQPCGNWTFMSLYVYLGAQDDVEFKTVWGELLAERQPVVYQQVTPLRTWWDHVEKQPLEPIIPVNVMYPRPPYYGGVPSVLVSRQHVSNGSFAASVKYAVDVCQSTGVCPRQELYQDITGNIGSPQPANVSVNAGMRTALFHYVYGANSTAKYPLGPHSYFSESAYAMTGWEDRYWGDNYAQLLEVKTAVDPAHVFDCRHCVGSLID